MSHSEFKLIDDIFKHAGGSTKPFTCLAIGDDASIHEPEPDMALIVSTDTSVQGVHWPDDFPLDKAADRAVCSALSDLAAMGAEPVCAWLNVMAIDSATVKSMGQGCTAALKRYDIELAGGDTCRSSTNALAVTVAGQLPTGDAMRRDAANIDDTVWLCGRVGFHALGLQQWFDHQRQGEFIACFESISPLLNAGIQLRQAGVACCIDVSDGLLQDAEHICRASNIGMDIEVTHLPDWHYLCEQVGLTTALQAVTQGGEDYALLFTAPKDIDIPHGLAVRIGQCYALTNTQEQGVHVLMNGQKTKIGGNGFDHFN